MVNNALRFLKVVRLLRNWPGHYLHKHGKGECLTYILRNGLKFTIRTGTFDQLIFKEIWIKEHYHPQLRSNSLRDLRLIIDIGAHIGSFTLYAAHLSPMARILAFEPHPDNFALLSRNISNNNLDRVTAHPCGVAAENGWATLISSTENSGAHQLADFRQEKPDGSAATEVIDLMAFLEARQQPLPDMIKCDCEGGEFEIFFPMSSAKLRSIPYIAMEVHQLDRARNPDTMLAHLERHGFTTRISNRCEESALIHAYH